MQVIFLPVNTLTFLRRWHLRIHFKRPSQLLRRKLRMLLRIFPAKGASLPSSGDCCKLKAVDLRTVWVVLFFKK